MVIPGCGVWRLIFNYCTLFTIILYCLLKKKIMSEETQMELEEEEQDEMLSMDIMFMEELSVNEEDLQMFQDAAQTVQESSLAPNAVQTKEARQHLATCHKCRKQYYTLDGYKGHLKCHMFEDYFRESAPVQDQFLEHCQGEAQKIFLSIASKKMDKSLAGDCVQMASFFIANRKEANDFVDCIGRKLWMCVPPASTISLSNFHCNFVDAVISMQSCDEVCDEFSKSLKDSLPQDYSPAAVKWFVGFVPFQLSIPAEAFVLRCIRMPHESCLPQTVRDNADDPKFRQSVYYVGGACVKSVLRMGLKATKDVCWIKVISVITDKFFSGPLPEGGITAWTDAVDRGGLKYINDSVWGFLMALSSILKDIEAEDGSILHNAVIAKVKEDPIMLLWEDLIQGSLSPEHSDFLLGKMCYYFGNTWGAGVVQRRKNEIAEINRDKVAFRASLLPRKS